MKEEAADAQEDGAQNVAPIIEEQVSSDAQLNACSVLMLVLVSLTISVCCVW